MLRSKSSKFLSVALLLIPTIVLTDEPTTLQAIMQGLRDNLVEISDGLLTDDYALVARGATAIAEHPQIPPEQVQLVAKDLGPEMPAFKQLDNVVHDLSLEIGAAAKILDRDAVIVSYQRMIEGCLNCHNTYKERVTAALL